MWIISLLNTSVCIHFSFNIFNISYLFFLKKGVCNAVFFSRTFTELLPQSYSGVEAKIHWIDKPSVPHCEFQINLWKFTWRKLMWKRNIQVQIKPCHNIFLISLWYLLSAFSYFGQVNYSKITVFSLSNWSIFLW